MPPISDPSWAAVYVPAILGVVTFFTPYVLQFITNWRQITYKVISDEPFINIPAPLLPRVSVSLDGHPIHGPHGTERDVNLIVLGVRNSGFADIGKEEYNASIGFQFDGREIIELTAVTTSPCGLIDQEQPERSITASGSNAIPGKIILPQIGLNRNNSVTISALIKGPKGNITPQGAIIHGKVKPYVDRRITSKFLLKTVGCLLLVVSIAMIPLIYYFYSRPLIGPDCVPGSLSIGGSTAMYPLVNQVALTYQAHCPGANISVNKNMTASEDGLLGVQNGTLQIGDSDITAPILVDHPVAVVTFVIVLNQRVTNVANLTAAQLRGIFQTGSITNWNQVGGPNLPIFVVSRTTTSGTRQTFEQYVLGGRETLPLSSRHIEVGTTDLVAAEVQSNPGAIGYVDRGTATRLQLNITQLDGTEAFPENVESNKYHFWAIEHMFTKDIPSGLTATFLQYMTKNDAQVIINALNYVSYNLMSAEAKAAHQK